MIMQGMAKFDPDVWAWGSRARGLRLQLVVITSLLHNKAHQKIPRLLWIVYLNALYSFYRLAHKIHSIDLPLVFQRTHTTNVVSTTRLTSMWPQIPDPPRGAPLFRAVRPPHALNFPL